MKRRKSDLPILFATISAGAWLVGALVGLAILSTVAPNDQGSWPFWLVTLPIAAVAGYWHFRLAPRCPVVVNIFLSICLGFAALASAFALQPGLEEGRQAINSRIALERFRRDYGKLEFPSSTYLGGEMNVPPGGGLRVTFRTSDSVAAVLRFYKWRLPNWPVTPVKAEWGTHQLKAPFGKKRVIRIGDSIDDPGKTEVILYME
jgi:hypothetical protein